MRLKTVGSLPSKGNRVRVPDSPAAVKSPYRLRQKSHRDSNIRESLPLTSGSGRRAEVETSPKTCRFEESSGIVPVWFLDMLVTLSRKREHMKGIIESKKSLKKAVVMVLPRVLGCIPAFGVSVPKGAMHMRRRTPPAGICRNSRWSRACAERGDQHGTSFQSHQREDEDDGSDRYFRCLHRLPGINIRTMVEREA